MSTTEVMADWQSLVSERSPAKRYFDPDHPLDLLYGSDPAGKPVFVMVTSDKPDDSPVSQDITRSLAQRGDGRWATSLRLEDVSLFTAFSRLCLDLVNRSAGEMSEEAAVKAVSRTLDEWKLLLRRYKVRRLSLHELRGLVAELWYGFEILTDSHRYDDVAQAWTGPLKAPQDFTFLDGSLCEVKARRSSAATVGVASVEQLDPGDKQLTLAVVVLDDCDSDKPDGFTIIDILHNIRTVKDLSFEGRSRVDNLLLSLGFDATDSYYAETFFQVIGFQEFLVDDSFPSIQGKTVASLPVSKVRYDIAMEPLERWQIREVTLQEQGGSSE